MRIKRLVNLLLVLSLVTGMSLAVPLRVRGNATITLHVDIHSVNEIKLTWDPDEIKGAYDDEEILVKITLEESTDGNNYTDTDYELDSTEAEAIYQFIIPRPSVITHYQLVLHLNDKDGDPLSVEYSSIATFDPDVEANSIINIENFLKNLTFYENTHNTVTIMFDSVIDFSDNRYGLSFEIQESGGSTNDYDIDINAMDISQSMSDGYYRCTYKITGLTPDKTFSLWLRVLDNFDPLTPFISAPYPFANFNTNFFRDLSTSNITSNSVMINFYSPINFSNSTDYSFDYIVEITGKADSEFKPDINELSSGTGESVNGYIRQFITFTGLEPDTSYTVRISTKDANGDYSSYVAFPPFTTLSTGGNNNIIYGDLTGTGTVTNADLILMMRRFAVPATPIPNEPALDVNGDGKFDNADLLLFLKYFAIPGTILGPQ